VIDMTGIDIFLALSLIFGLTSTLAFLYLYTLFTKQRSHLLALSKDLDRALRCLNGPATKEEDVFGFAASLDEETMKTKLQQYSAVKHANRDEVSTVPERYRHVSTLANHGLDKDAISAILQIPIGETEQLLKLCNITGQCA